MNTTKLSTMMRRSGKIYSTLMMLVFLMRSFQFVTAIGQRQSFLYNSTTTTTPKKGTGEELNANIQRYLGTRRRLRHDGLVRWFMEYPVPSQY